MTDLVTFGETMLRLSPPRGDRLETTRELAVQAGGAESNVAVGAARLGVDAAWLSKLPDSPLGRRVTSELRSHGVSPEIAWADPDESRVGTYYLEHGGAPRGTNVIYDRANAAITTVEPDELPAAPLDGAEWFHTTGITPALSPAAAETTTTGWQSATASCRMAAALWRGSTSPTEVPPNLRTRTGRLSSSEEENQSRMRKGGGCGRQDEQKRRSGNVHRGTA